MKKINRISLIITSIITLALFSAAAHANLSTDLSGKWRFSLDPNDVGQSQKWFNNKLPQKIKLPGSLQAQGYGFEPSPETKWIGSIKDQSWFKSPEYKKFRQPGNIKIPCWLQPEKHYVGPAWYQRDITIPKKWNNKQIVLFLERAHWTTDVWIGDKHIGSGESLGTPHQFILPANLSAGKHTLTIKVDNRIKFKIGNDSHSITDHTQTNWNGIIGDIKLIARPKVWIESVTAYPTDNKNKYKVVVHIANATAKPGGTAFMQIAVPCREPIERQFKIKPDTMKFKCEIPLSQSNKLWDEFKPDLFDITVTLKANVDGETIADTKTLRTGIRTISSNGKRVTINDRPIFLRGTLECCIFPNTGYPPTDKGPWLRIMQICRDHGLNHIRFHSWCPPRAAFEVADQMGFYLQVELPTWAYDMGRHKDRDAFLKRELDRTLETYGNHPSFILMTMGNELRGNDEFLTALVEQAKEKDPRRIYSSTSHHHRSKSDQFRITMRIGNEKIKKKGIKIRGLRGPKTDWDFADAIKDENIPVIAHEIGQFCAWPDLSEIRQYRGLLKAKNFELFGDRLTQRGMKRQARDFLMASGKLQAICYKEEIESLMRTPDFGGFQLLDLHDFPGQGTSLVGVLNPYWKSKGYITAREYRRFAGQTVPLARFEKRTWTNNETFTAQIDLSHFGQHDLKKCKAEWKLIDISNRTIAKGKLPAINAPASSLTTIGQISINLSSIKEPSKLKLSVSIPSATASNDWNLWIYPNTTDDSEPENVYIASSLDDKAITTLAKGGNVVMLPPIANINGRHESWQPIFWNTQWISRTGNRSLGLLCSSKHPALADFPTDFHSDWQWHGLMNNSKTVNLAHTPEGLKPIVQVIPDWNNPQREAMIFECKVGKGNLLFCSADLTGDLQERTTAKQLRKSLLKYAAGESFEPKTEMSLSQIRSMLISM